MSKRVVQIPVKNVNGDDWAELNFFGADHVICGEKMAIKDQNYTFAGGHRVRLYSVKKNVHWKVPARGITLDITDVPKAGNPPRRQPMR